MSNEKLKLDVVVSDILRSPTRSSGLSSNGLTATPFPRFPVARMWSLRWTTMEPDA